MFFPVKLILRREIWPPKFVTDIVVEAFWRRWAFKYVRPTKPSDRNYHLVKGWD